jgi:hypothetical protein
MKKWNRIGLGLFGGEGIKERRRRSRIESIDKTRDVNDGTGRTASHVPCRAVKDADVDGAGSVGPKPTVASIYVCLFPSLLLLFPYFTVSLSLLFCRTFLSFGGPGGRRMSS